MTARIGVLAFIVVWPVIAACFVNWRFEPDWEAVFAVRDVQMNRPELREVP